MRTLHLLALSGVLATACHPDKPATPSGPPAINGGTALMGRFQIISGSVSRSGKQVPVLLRLDTMTGATWELDTVQIDSTHAPLAYWSISNETADLKQLIPMAAEK